MALRLRGRLGRGLAFGGHLFEEQTQVPDVEAVVPLAVEVVTNSRLAGRVTAVVAAGIWFVAWADTVRTGGHWPIDQIAGLLIAVSLLTVVYSAASRSREHDTDVHRPRIDSTNRH